MSVGGGLLLCIGPRTTRAPLVPAQIWDADEGGAAPADMAMPGTGVGMSHTSMRDFQELVTVLSGLVAMCCKPALQDNALCANAMPHMSAVCVIESCHRH